MAMVMTRVSTVTADSSVTDSTQVDEILQLCSSIGMRDHDEASPSVYHKGKECRDVLVDLTRMLRREDRHSKHGHLRQLGVFQVFEKDLVPLLIEYAGTMNSEGNERERKENERMLFALLKLMVAMSMPAMMTFDGAADDKIEKTTEFSQQVDFLRSYKDAMTKTWNMIASESDLANERQLRYSSPAALEALLKILYKPLTVDLRTSRQEDFIELVLLMIRNIVHTPDKDETYMSRESLQDRAILAFDQVGVFDLIVSLAHDMEANEIFAGHIMEIVVYLLRGQTPSGLVSAKEDSNNEEQNRLRREKANSALKQQVRKEKSVAKATRAFQSTRHSRFGGAFVVKPASKDSAPKNHFSAVQRLKDKNRITTDARKSSRPKKKLGETVFDHPDREQSSRSVRLVLYKFVSSFLHEAYNNIMPVVYSAIDKSKGKGDTLMQYDEVHYCKILRFFMEFYRLDNANALEHAQSGKPDQFDVGIIAATLRKEDVEYIKDLIGKYSIQCKEDAGGRILWSQRLHQAVRAMHELLLYLDHLTRHGTDVQRDFAVAMQAGLFHEAEFLDKIPDIVKNFVPTKQSSSCGRDIVMLVHTLLRQLQTLESTAKFKLYQARRRKVKRKKVPEIDDAQAAVTDPNRADPTELARLFDTNDDQQPANADHEVRVTEFEFDFNNYVSKFADAKVVKMYSEVLQNYTTNGSKLNHAIVKMFHRILDDKHCDMRWLFYQLSVFDLCRTIINDRQIAKDAKFKELRGFIKLGVIANFFEDVKKYPLMFAEVLFWKSHDVVREIELGPSRAELARKTRHFKWTHEMEEFLRTLYQEHHDEEEALDIILEKLVVKYPECSERSSIAVKTKLSRMGLPIIAVSDWSDKELRELKELYTTLLEAGEPDPVAAVVEEEAFHPSKNTIPKIRHRLRKMGLEVPTAASAAAAARVWSEQQITDLKELHAEFAGLDLGLKLTIDAIMEDPRMEGKTANIIKSQLRELGLIQPAVTSTPWTDVDVDLLKELHASLSQQHQDTTPLVRAIMAHERWPKNSKTNMVIRKKLKDLGLITTVAPGGKRKAKAQQNKPRRGGELDQDFADSLASAATKLRKSGNTAQLNWLVQHMQTRIEEIENGDDGFIAHEMPPQSAESNCLKPLIGMLGFNGDDSSDSDSDDDDDSKPKPMKWAIDGAIPPSRLRDMVSVLEPEQDEDQQSDDGSSSEEELELKRTNAPQKTADELAQEAAVAKRRAMADLIAKRKRHLAKKVSSDKSNDSSDDDDDESANARRSRKKQLRRRLKGRFDSDEESESGDEDPLPSTEIASATEPQHHRAQSSAVVLDSDDDEEAPQQIKAGASAKRKALSDESDDSEDETNQNDTAMNLAEESMSLAIESEDQYEVGSTSKQARMEETSEPTPAEESSAMPIESEDQYAPSPKRARTEEQSRELYGTVEESASVAIESVDQYAPNPISDQGTAMSEDNLNSDQANVNADQSEIVESILY